MFFTPFLSNVAIGTNTFILCLSNGNAEGLGQIRQEELMVAGNILNVADVIVVDNEAL